MPPLQTYVSVKTVYTVFAVAYRLSQKSGTISRYPLCTVYEVMSVDKHNEMTYYKYTIRIDCNYDCYEYCCYDEETR